MAAHIDLVSKEEYGEKFYLSTQVVYCREIKEQNDTPTVDFIFQHGACMYAMTTRSIVSRTYVRKSSETASRESPTCLVLRAKELSTIPDMETGESNKCQISSWSGRSAGSGTAEVKQSKGEGPPETTRGVHAVPD